MAVYKFSNVGGFGTYQRYNDFLAGNSVVQLDKGSMFPLGVFTLASSAANVEFTNIPQTYTHLQIRAMPLCTANSPAGIIQFNSDTGTNYSLHRLYGSGATVGVDAFSTVNVIYTLIGPSTSTTPSSMIIDILDYKNTNKYKTVRTLGGGDNNGSGYTWLMSGNWRNTNAITSIKLYPDGGSWGTNSSFALYGINA